MVPRKTKTAFWGSRSPKKDIWNTDPIFSNLSSGYLAIFTHSYRKCYRKWSSHGWFMMIYLLKMVSFLCWQPYVLAMLSAAPGCCHRVHHPQANPRSFSPLWRRKPRKTLVFCLQEMAGSDVYPPEKSINMYDHVMIMSYLEIQKKNVDMSPRLLISYLALCDSTPKWTWPGLTNGCKWFNIFQHAMPNGS